MILFLIMSRFFKIIIVFIMVMGLSGVSISRVNASGLVPCGNGEGSSFTECSVCDLQQLAINLMKWFITIAVIVATALFVNTGILYVLSPSNPGNIAKAHNLFFATLVGMIIVFSAWMVINTVMVVLYDNASFGDWRGIVCSEGAQ